MRALPMDMIPGPVGLTDLTLTGADTFSTEQIADNIIAPDIIIDEDLFSQQGNLNIENVLSWDVFEFQLTNEIGPDVAGSEGVVQHWFAGITRDNTVNATGAPTSDAVAQHTRPGASESGTDSRFVERFQSTEIANEENAAGEINSSLDNWRHMVKKYNRVQVKTNMDVSEMVMNDAHYHFWGDSLNGTAAHIFSLGMRARRIEVDFMELMFDRNTLISILNAVGQVF